MHDSALPSLDLSFPDGEVFRSAPPRASFARVICRSHELRRWFPNAAPTAAERWQAKTTDEFRL
jgi:hypothetical protein